MMYIVAMLLAVASSVLYHLIARAIPTGVHPLISLTITYLTGAALSLALLPIFPLDAGLRDSLQKVNWTSFALAVAILGIEAGFLLAYRAGWDISYATLVANVAGTLVLLPIGVILIKERLSLTQVLGIAICVVGLILINRK